MVETVPEQPQLTFGLPKADLNSTRNLGSYLIESMNVATRDVIQAELAPPTSMAAMDYEQQKAASRGYLRYFVSNLDFSNPNTVDMLKELNGAIRSQDLATINRIDPKLASVLSIYSKNPKDFSAYNEYSYDYLQGQSDIAEVQSARATAEADRASAQFARTYALDAQRASLELTQTYLTASDNGRAVIVDRTIASLLADRTNASTIEDDAMRQTILDAANTQEKSLLDAVVLSALRGKAQVDVDRFAYAIRNEDTSELLPEEIAEYKDILKIISKSETAKTELKKILDVFREDFSYGNITLRGQALDNMEKNVTSQLSTLESSANINEVGQRFVDLSSLILNSANLTPEDRDVFLRSVNETAAKASVRLAFDFVTDSKTLAALEDYANTGASSPSLTEDMKSSIDVAREYANKTGLSEFFKRTVSGYAENKNKKIERVEKEKLEREAKLRAKTGQGAPETPEGRRVADAVLLDSINAEFVRSGAPTIKSLPFDIWSNASYLEDKKYQSAFRAIYQTPGLMPESLLTAARSLASGNVTRINGYDPAVILAHLDEIAFIEGPSGMIPNPAMKSLTLEERGKLELLRGLNRLYGNEPTAFAAFGQASAIVGTEAFQTMVKSFLDGEDINAWLMDNIGDDFMLLGPEQQASVRALAEFEIGMHFAADGRKTTASYLGSRISDQISGWFPDGEGIVGQFGSDGVFRGRTQYALSQTIPGFEDLFKSYVISQVAKYAPELSGINFYRKPGGIVATPGGFGGIPGEGIKPREKFIQLAVGGKDAISGVYYYVLLIDPKDGTRQMVMRNDNKGPLVIGVDEHDFLVQKKAEAAERNKKNTDEANKRAEFMKDYDASEYFGEALFYSTMSPF